MKHITIICLLLLTTALSAATKETEVPYWVMAGILAQETKSRYEVVNGVEHIVYVDQTVGAAGELSAFQITWKAWKQVHALEPDRRFRDLATDQIYAERVAMRYLLWLYNNSAKQSWPHAVQFYNRGPGKLSYSYYANVVAKARKAGYPEN